MIPRELDWLLSFSKLLLESRDVERVVLPTIVDALVERDGADSVWRWRCMSQLRVLHVIGAAIAATTLDRLRAVPWVSVSALGLSGICGAIALQRRSGLGPSPVAHCMYVGLAALLAVIVLSVPGKIASVLRCSAYAVVALAFVACPWFGRAFEGRQQWLGLGPLFVHVASIGLPAFAVFSFSTIKRRQYARYAVVAGGVLVLLCLQRNLSDACLYVAVAILCALQWRPSWLLYASWCSSGLVGLVLLRRFLDGSSWEQVGLGALGAVFVRMVWVFTARERRGRDGVSSRWLRGMSLGSVLCTVLIVRELAGDGIPLLSAGASIMISVFMLFAIALRSLEPAQG